MRRCLTVIFVVLAAVLAAPTPAYAIDYNPICQSDSSRPGEIVCQFAPTGGRPMTSIDWTLDGDNVVEWHNFPRVSIICAAGAWHAVGHTIVFADGEVGSGSTRTLCRGARIKIADFDCDTGGSRINCHVTIADGTPPFVIRWKVNGVDKSQFNDQTGLRIGCQPGRSFSVEVKVRDQTFTSLASEGGCNCSRDEQ